MNQEVKRDWVEALRSGKFKQGTNYLKKRVKDEIQYCCLGVLCEILGEDGKEDGRGVFIFKLLFTTVLPQTVVKKAELKNGFGAGIIYKGSEEALVALNDSFELPFSEIADLIEEQL